MSPLNIESYNRTEEGLSVMAIHEKLREIEIRTEIVCPRVQERTPVSVGTETPELIPRVVSGSTVDATLDKNIELQIVQQEAL